jgi:nucleoside 2-deoxyribosyltransferase
VKIYLAGSSQEQQRLRSYATLLRGAGHEITSGWLQVENIQDVLASHLGPEQVTEEAVRDLADIYRADAVLMVVPYDRTNLLCHSGGRQVEVGYALAQAKPVIIVGPPENIFHRGLCLVVGSMEEAIETALLNNHY